MYEKHLICFDAKNAVSKFIRVCGDGTWGVYEDKFCVIFFFSSAGLYSSEQDIFTVYFTGTAEPGWEGGLGALAFPPPPPIWSQNISTSESLDLTICWEIYTQTSIETPTSEAFFQLPPPPPPPSVPIDFRSAAPVLSPFIASQISCADWSYACQQIDDGSGMKKECTVEDLVKVVEELTRIH